MASHDSWIDAGELAALAGELAPPEQQEGILVDDADDSSAPSQQAYVPFISEASEPEEFDVIEKPAVLKTAPVKVQATSPMNLPGPELEMEADEEGEYTGASPEVLALWNRKLADIKKRAQSNGLLTQKNTPKVPSEAPPKPSLVPFTPPSGSISERLAALSRWLLVSAPDCEFFACDDWGNELLSGANASPDLAAAALTLSFAACEAGRKAGDGTPAFVGTDLGDGLLTVFPSTTSNGRRFLGAVSEEPFTLETARQISAAFRTVV